MGNARFTFGINDTTIYDSHQNDPYAVAYQAGYQGEGVIRTTLYHGTSESCGHLIALSQKLHKSTDGRLGPGIYFVKSYSEALKIAWYRSEQQSEKGAAVIKVAAQSVDSPNWLTIGQHPRWGGIRHPFQEYCINKGSVDIISITIHRKDNSTEQLI